QRGIADEFASQERAMYLGDPDAHGMTDLHRTAFRAFGGVQRAIRVPENPKGEGQHGKGVVCAEDSECRDIRYGGVAPGFPVDINRPFKVSSSLLELPDIEQCHAQEPIDMGRHFGLAASERERLALADKAQSRKEVAAMQFYAPEADKNGHPLLGRSIGSKQI